MVRWIGLNKKDLHSQVPFRQQSSVQEFASAAPHDSSCGNDCYNALWPPSTPPVAYLICLSRRAIHMSKGSFKDTGLLVYSHRRGDGSRNGGSFVASHTGGGWRGVSAGPGHRRCDGHTAMEEANKGVKQIAAK